MKPIKPEHVADVSTGLAQPAPRQKWQRINDSSNIFVENKVHEGKNYPGLFDPADFNLLLWLSAGSNR